MRLMVRGLVLVIAVATAATHYAQGNTLNEEDLREIQELFNEGHQLEASIVQGARSPEVNALFKECRSQLAERFLNLSIEISYVNILVVLSTRMTDRQDERWVLLAIKAEAGAGLRGMANLNRKTANSVFATCSLDEFTVSKAKEVLNFVNHVDAFARRIDERIQSP